MSVARSPSTLTRREKILKVYKSHKNVSTASTAITTDTAFKRGLVIIHTLHIVNVFLVFLMCLYTPHTRCHSQFRFASSTKSSIYVFLVWKKPWPVLLPPCLERSLSSHISCAGWCCMLSCTPSING